MSAAWNFVTTFFNPIYNDNVFGGYSVDITDNYAVISSTDPSGVDDGLVYLIDIHTGNLLRTFLSVLETGKLFGYTVALNNNQVLISHRAAVFLYDINTDYPIGFFANPTAPDGVVVALNNSYVAIGAFADDTQANNRGVVDIYDPVTGQLVMTIPNPTPDESHLFGLALQMSGDHIFIGSPNDNSLAAGGAVYRFDITTGNLLQTFTNPTPAEQDSFGYSLAVSDDYLVVGAAVDDTNANNSGSAYLFNINTGDLLYTFLNPTPADDDRFGSAVAISGSQVLIGAYRDDTIATDSGAAYLFNTVNGNLEQTFLNPGSQARGLFGYSLDISNFNILINAPKNISPSSTLGASYLYQLPFDPAQYGSSNSDLLVSFGYDLQGLTQHYLNSGQFEGRPTDTFDELRYIASNPDLINAYGLNGAGATEHYIRSGYYENRSLTRFDPQQYLASYPDLIAGIGDHPSQATLHYISSGFSEGRAADTFDASRYILSYPDLLNTFGTNVAGATEHWIEHGFTEGRNPNLFESDRYIASYGDLIANLGYNLEAGSNHYLSEGIGEGRQVLFDPLAYLNHYPDLSMAFAGDLTAATQHYILFGYNEGRTWS
jgi:hypothetical protein